MTSAIFCRTLGNISHVCTKACLEDTWWNVCLVRSDSGAIPSFVGKERSTFALHRFIAELVAYPCKNALPLSSVPWEFNLLNRLAEKMNAWRFVRSRPRVRYTRVCLGPIWYQCISDTSLPIRSQSILFKPILSGTKGRGTSYRKRVGRPDLERRGSGRKKRDRENIPKVPGQVRKIECFFFFTDCWCR